MGGALIIYLRGQMCKERRFFPTCFQTNPAHTGYEWLKEAIWFGPFRQYLVNASWEAAEGLKRAGLGEGIEICIAEIPVAIHLGIAPGAKCIILEQTAKNHGYKDRDVCGFCPANNCCIEGGVERVDSIISMRSLAKHLKGLGLDVIYSRDAGRYLCDFVYYCSLQFGQRRAALIHVPASGCLAQPETLVPQLQVIIQALVCQLDEHTITKQNQIVP
ncbi:hypothetical protein NFI96_017142 [Prochilodus magdalenae]|nr:hypothetical protein NFI96_017142 [Prochilodus magdalenae]